MLEIVRVILALLISCAPAALAAQAAAPSTASPEALARAVQDRYRSVRDFSADFTQTYRGGALKTSTTESGTVVIKKPGRMRWVYTKPERKEVIADGTRSYLYLPADKQVIVSGIPSDDRASTPALFLAGKGDVSRDFTASLTSTPAPGTVALKLTPRRNEPDYEYFVLVIDPGTLQIRSLTTRDRQGGEWSLTFAKLKENQGISDKEFVFRTPRGVDVVTTDDSGN
jgi:outer membrane lipoprotein carrier protein